MAAHKPIPVLTDSERERFLASISKTDGCWIWTGVRRATNYGVFQITRNGKQRVYAAHRLSLALAQGDPGDKVVCHRCDNPPCVNPNHLYAGTQADNIHDRDSRGRNHCANKTHCAHGHEFTPENTVVPRSGVRYCLACRRLQFKAFYIARQLGYEPARPARGKNARPGARAVQRGPNKRVS